MGRVRTSLAQVSLRSWSLTALIATSVALFAISVALHSAIYGVPVPLAFAFGLALSATPLLSLVWPKIAIAIFCPAAVLLPLFTSETAAITAPWPWSVPTLLLFVLFFGTLTFTRGAAYGAFPLVIGVIGSLVAPIVRPDLPFDGAGISNLTVGPFIGAVAFVIAVLARGRLRMGDELVRERQTTALEQAQRALVEERTRIARELHDVVAHNMSVVQIQASSARYRLPEVSADVAAEFDSIAASARTSLTEMRRLLGVLRTEDQRAELAPQHGIADIPDLVDSVRRAGVTVGLEVIGNPTIPPAAVPPAVQIAAFRIAQEALSNSLRHAVGSAITMRVNVGADSISIRIRNTRPDTPAPQTGGGHGLRGMRERVELLGGSLTAMPTSDEGWEVVASLPHTTQTPATTQENP